MNLITKIKEKQIFGFTTIAIATTSFAIIEKLNTVLDFLDRIGITRQKILHIMSFIHAWLNIFFPLSVIYLIWHCDYLKKRMNTDKAFIDNWIMSKGDIDREMMLITSTGLRAFVAYINSISTKENAEAIANTLYDANLVIPDCEKIGLKKIITSFMWTRYYKEKIDEHKPNLENETTSNELT